MFIVLKLKQWVTEPVESMALQAPRALAVSVLALAADFGIYALCLLVGMPALLAALIGYLAGGVLQYVLCSLWVFSTSLKNDALGFVAFSVLSLVGLGITEIVILIVHDCLGIHPYPAKFAAVGLAFTWNFLSRKYLLFRASRA
ncbi:MAG: GtrA family protein [Gemmataceae bacterium]|nr:GtrA family protein [Gemmataceae bacterium]